MEDNEVYPDKVCNLCFSVFYPNEKLPEIEIQSRKITICPTCNKDDTYQTVARMIGIMPLAMLLGSMTKEMLEEALDSWEKAPGISEERRTLVTDNLKFLIAYYD